MPYRIYPADQMTNGGNQVAGYTLISILFSQELNWPFVVNSPVSSSQIFAYLPVLIQTALNIDRKFFFFVNYLCSTVLTRDDS